jgi:hypothetical protein
MAHTPPGVDAYAFEYDTPYRIDQIHELDPNAATDADNNLWAIIGPREYVFRDTLEGWILDHTWGQFLMYTEVEQA